MPKPLHVIILAAGEGKRMKSSLPKVLQRIAGQPMLADMLSYDGMTPLFEAAEKAIVNSTFRATTMSGYRGTIPALPLELVWPRLRGTVADRPAQR